jgi:heme exporter protein A
MIVIQDLVKTYGLHPVLRKLNLTIERGQFVTLLGNNGSGKSTLLRILAALSKPTSGTVKIGGWDLPQEAFAVRRQLGVVSHLPLLYDTLTAEENLLFFAQLYDLSPEEGQQRTKAVLEQVGLKYRASDQVRTFSRGMLQRLTIARAIIHDPAILLFDEPYTGLDQQASAVLDELLTDQAKTGRTIIMTTHDIQRGHALASHMAVLTRGKIGFLGECRNIPPSEVLRLYTETIGATHD